MNSLGHLREFWSPASQSERSVAGGCHFNYLMQDLAGDRPSHMFASLFFFSSRHFCVLPPVDPQAAAGHGGRLLPSGSVWLLLAYLLSAVIRAFCWTPVREWAAFSRSRGRKSMCDRWTCSLIYGVFAGKRRERFWHKCVCADRSRSRHGGVEASGYGLSSEDSTETKNIFFSSVKSVQRESSQDNFIP